mgnify:CR=1 FL=1
MSRLVHLGDFRREMVILQKDLHVMLTRVNNVLESLTFDKGDENDTKSSK